MQITIPQEYCWDRFSENRTWFAPREGNKRLPCIVQDYAPLPIFIVQWNENELLFMNKEEKDRLLAKGGQAEATLRLQIASLASSQIRDGIVTIPESYEQFFRDKNLGFEEIEAGLRVFYSVGNHGEITEKVRTNKEKWRRWLVKWLRNMT